MTGSETRDQIVIVENGVIRAVGHELAIPDGARVVDLSTEWLVPGLIDAHTHLALAEIGGNAPSEAVLLTEVGRAKAFAASPDLAATMKAAGIIGTLRIRFRHGDYTRKSATSYATMTLTVRDCETSLKAYAMDAADRKAASLTDLAVLQMNDDPNNLLILWAVGDVARATAFFDSPALAVHMAKNAGVVASRIFSASATVMVCSHTCPTLIATGRARHWRRTDQRTRESYKGLSGFRRTLVAPRFVRYDEVAACHP